MRLTNYNGEYYGLTQILPEDTRVKLLYYKGKLSTIAFKLWFSDDTENCIYLNDNGGRSFYERVKLLEYLAGLNVEGSQEALEAVQNEPLSTWGLDPWDIEEAITDP